MPRDAQASNSNYFSGTPPSTAAPWSCSAWLYPTDAAYDGFWFGMGDGTTNNYWRAAFVGSQAQSIKFYVAAGGTQTSITSGIAYAINNWYRVTLVEGSATDHRIYVNGGTPASSAASRVPSGVNYMNILRFMAVNPAFKGLIGPLTFWPGYALSDQEAHDDYRGVLVGRQYRVDYSMDGRADEIDLYRSFPLTMNGTVLTVSAAGAPLSLRNRMRRARNRKRPVYSIYTGPAPATTKLALIQWSNAQGTAITPPPPPPPPPNQQQIFWGDSRILQGESADRAFSAHAARLQIFGPSSIGMFKFQNIPESTGLLDATGRTLIKKVQADPANEGVTKNWFMMQVGNNNERYNPSNPNDNSIRITATSGNYTTEIQPGADVWYALSFVLDKSLYEDMGAPTSNDTTINDIHHTGHNVLTPFTLMADPPNSAGITLKFRLRRWDPPDQVNPNGTAKSADKVFLANAVAYKRYNVFAHFRMGYLAAHNPWHETYLQVNGAWQNNGNPIYTWDGTIAGTTGRALGYNSNPYLHETRTLMIYNWLCETQFNVNGQTNPAAWPRNVNNIPAPGDKGWRLWYRCGFAILGRASTVGEAPVTQYTLAALLNAASI